MDTRDSQGTLAGVFAGVVLLLVFSIGSRTADEFLVVLPIMAIELVVLYAAMLTMVYLPLAALCRAAGRTRLFWLASLVLWPSPLLLARGVGALFDLNTRPTLADDVAFLLANLGMGLPLLAGFAVAGFVFTTAAVRLSTADERPPAA